MQIVLTPGLFHVLDYRDVFPFGSNFIVGVQHRVDFLFGYSRSVSAYLPGGAMVTSVSVKFRVAEVLSSVYGVISRFADSASYYPS